MSLRPLLLIGLALLAACGTEPSVCGDGVRQPGEACDGVDVGGATCESEGFGPGTIGCAPNCRKRDRSACGAPPSCGNGVKDGPEVCDGADLGGATCEQLGLGAGTLGCSANCAELDVSGCAAPPTCGNGARDGVEVCDGTNLGGATCELLGEKGGTLRCAASCLSYDKSGCPSACVPQCGSQTCGVDPVCGQPCGTCDALSVCERGQCKKACDLDPIVNDTNIDVALKTVQVSGSLMLNGAPMPANSLSPTMPRGWVVFTNRDFGLAYQISIGPSGSTYQGTVLAGTYDVDFRANSESSQNLLPDQRLRLRLRRGCF